ncbi:hypothetical protein SAMN02745866_02811 [Alteromonadaceae bacterium Bs31]|nr:hypothetical protein SAMN02745866_02811 [Alteromonadaceae bacterium Bs31]
MVLGMPELGEQILLLVVSLIANTLSATAGGGAGLLQLPLLLFMGLAFSTALATHKIATVALGVGATLKHAREGNTHLRFALFILAAGLPGVFLGANIILSIDERHAKVALGTLTIGLGVYSLFKKKLGQNFSPKNRNLTGMTIGGLILFSIGFLNGSLTSGTGLFVTMWLVLWFGLDYKRATAYTMILVGMFWNGTGAITLALLTSVKWSWLPVLILSSLLGGYLGASISTKYGNPLIKKVFEFLTISVGLSLIVSTING